MNVSAAEARNTAAPEEPGPGGMAALFALESFEADMFRSRALPGRPGRQFGGHLAAQALAAACQTVTAARPHSLHGYFLRPGDPTRPMVFQVDRLHDGRTFRRRRVTVIQNAEPVFSLESSFTADALGATDYPPAPEVPAPADCAVCKPPGPPRGPLSPWNLVEVRPVRSADGAPRLVAAEDCWFRFRDGVAGAVPPEVLVAYLSDLTLAGTLLRPLPRSTRGHRTVTDAISLDHAVWFHNPPDPADWLLFEKDVPASAPARGLVAGRLFGRDGALVASVTQEALVYTE